MSRSPVAVTFEVKDFPGPYRERRFTLFVDVLQQFRTQMVVADSLSIAYRAEQDQQNEVIRKLSRLVAKEVEEAIVKGCHEAIAKGGATTYKNMGG